MSVRYLVASAAVTAIVVLTVSLTRLSFQRAILLAPVLVIGAAAAAGLAVFWGRVGWESLQKSRRPRLILAASVAFVALLVLLTVLGVKLPHE
jgi:formate hydrogenlyase subunit 3/multisubunit Na+/H+ antiporter MnhD subunit